MYIQKKDPLMRGLATIKGKKKKKKKTISLVFIRRNTIHGLIGIERPCEFLFCMNEVFNFTAVNVQISALTKPLEIILVFAFIPGHI